MADVVSTINKRANAQRKVNRQVDCTEIINFINYTNNLTDDDLILENNFTLEDILVPNEFTQFVLPSSIRVNPLDRRTNDLIDRASFQKCQKVTVADFRIACDAFRGAFKLDAYQNVTSLATLKKSRALFDVISDVSVNGKVHGKDEPFIPIPIKGCNSLFNENYLNDDYDSIVLRFCNEIKFI